MATLQSKLILSLTDRVSGPAKAINATLSRLQQSMDRTRSALFDAVGVGYVLARSISAPIKSAMAFESAMADVRKVVDFDTVDGFDKMGTAIREMSTRIPIAAEGLAKIVAAGGQSGIATQDLEKFTELAAKLGVAWEISADDAGSSIAKLMTSLGRSIDETASLGDAINYLSDKSAASAPQILDVVKRVGPMAKTFGFSAEQIAALGAAMTGSGFESEVASTSILNIGKALTKGASATKRQRDAFKRLGLSSKAVAKSMQKDAAGTLQNVLARINKIPKEAQAALVSDLFGDEARALGPLIANGQLLANVMQLVGDKTKYAGSAQREFESRSRTSGNNLQLFQNRLNDLSIAIGNAFLPSLNALLDKIGPVVTSLAQLAERYPKLLSGIVGVTAALVGARVAFLALKFAGLFAATGLLAFAAKALSLSAIIGRLLKLGTGLGLVLTAIGAAGTFIYNNWRGIEQAFAQFGRSFRQAIEPLWPLLQPITDGVARLHGWISKLTGPVDGLGESWFRMGHRAGKALGETLVAVTQFAVDLPGKLAAIDWAKLGNDLQSALASIDFAGGWHSLVAGAKAAISDLRTTITDGLRGIDWSAVGKAAGDALKAALELARNAVANFDWGSVGQAIGQALRAAFMGLVEIRTALTQAILGTDGGASIASSIGSALGNAIRNFDWPGVGRSINALIYQGVMANLSMLNGLIKGAFNIDLADIGARAIQSLWDGMKARFEAFIAWVRTIPSQIRSAIGNIDLSGAAKLNYGGQQFRNPTNVDGKRAAGGPVSAGKTYLVGERGPELFSPRNAGVITPNHALARAGAGVPTSVQVHVGGITIAGVADPRAAAGAAAQQLGSKVKEAVEAAHSD